MSWKCLASIAAAMLVPTCVMADDDQTAAPREWPHPPGGWLHPYVALDLGYHWPLAIDATSIGPAPDGQPYQWGYKLNGDWDAFLRVGYRLPRTCGPSSTAGCARATSTRSIRAARDGANGLAAGRPGEP